MGVFSGLITFGFALWYLQTVSKINETVTDENKKNGWVWFWIGGGVYLGGSFLGYLLNDLFVGGKIDVPIGDGLAEASGGDSGLLGITLEFLPIIIGVVAAYVVRKQWLLNEKFDFSFLMSRFSNKK